MNPSLYTHLAAAQDEMNTLVQTWAMSEVPASCRNAVLSIKAHIDKAMEPVDDEVAVEMLREACRTMTPEQLEAAGYQDIGKIDPLSLSGTMDADQLNEAAIMHAPGECDHCDYVRKGERLKSERMNCAECGAPLKWCGPHYTCSGCGRHGGHGGGGGGMVLLSYDMRGTGPITAKRGDAGQLSEAATIRTLSEAQGRIKAALRATTYASGSAPTELAPGHNQRSGQFDAGHAIRSAEESRMDGTDKWDGLSPADVEGEDPDPTAS